MVLKKSANHKEISTIQQKHFMVDHHIKKIFVPRETNKSIFVLGCLT